MFKVAELMFKPREHMFAAFEYKIYLVVNKNPPNRKIKSIRKQQKKNYLQIITFILGQKPEKQYFFLMSTLITIR